MDRGAERIHKLSMKNLEELSCGRRFSDDAAEIAADFLSADIIIAHNLPFDYKFLEKEFERLAWEFKYKDALCTMRYFTPHCKLSGNARNTYKYPKLEELGKHFDMDENTIAGMAADVFTECLGAHDSRYDTALMYLCVKKAIKDNILCDKIKRQLAE
jgi:DNA polymerase-3 subunit epsilon